MPDYDDQATWWVIFYLLVLCKSSFSIFSTSGKINLIPLRCKAKTLLALEPFNPKKERISFRGDIFTRLIESGTFLAENVIEYQLSIGVKWLVRDNRKQYWKLPMKK